MRRAWMRPIWMVAWVVCGTASVAAWAVCPTGTLMCSAGWCCPPGQGGRTDVCCNQNPQASGCTANGSCATGGGSPTQCPSGTLSCSAGWCCPPGQGGRTDVCCNQNPQASGCTANGSCSNATGGGGAVQCPSGSSACAAGWCCPPGQGGRTDVCCNSNPSSSGCTTNGSCSTGGSGATGGGGGSSGSGSQHIQWGCATETGVWLWPALLLLLGRRPRRLALGTVLGLMACSPTVDLTAGTTAQALGAAPAVGPGVPQRNLPGALSPGLEPLSGRRAARSRVGNAAEPAEGQAEGPDVAQAAECEDGWAP